VRLWDGDGEGGAWSRPARFVTGLLREEEWHGTWIAAVPDRVLPPHRRGSNPASDPETRLPIFRRRFQARAAPLRAIVSVVGLGQFELTVNGEPVTASLLDPAWSYYRKIVYYRTFDVSGLVRPGENMLGVMLGNGMYDVQHVPGRYTKFADSFGVPKLRLEMTLVHADGTTEQVASDRQWRTRPGPILFSSIYGGEDVDGRLDQPGWNRPGASDEGWAPVVAVQGPGGRLRAQGVPPIVVAETLNVRAVTRPRAGATVYDFGENNSARPVRRAPGSRCCPARRSRPTGWSASAVTMPGLTAPCPSPTSLPAAGRSGSARASAIRASAISRSKAMRMSSRSPRNSSMPTCRRPATSPAATRCSSARTRSSIGRCSAT
jgi:alpha-L-rhamnosidase